MSFVLVVRENDVFSQIIESQGFEVTNLPLIEIKPLADLSDFEAKFEKIQTYDGIFLTSKNSASVLADNLREKKIAYKGKVYVLGKRSFEILQTENLNLVFFETANTVREMFEMISLDELKGKRFLFIRGEKSLRFIPEHLGDFSKVDEAIVYQNEKLFLETGKIEEIRQLFQNQEISCVCFFSPSGGESFLAQFGASNLHQTKIAVIGETTAGFFEEKGLKVDFIAAKATAEDFAVELAEYLQNGKSKPGIGN